MIYIKYYSDVKEFGGDYFSLILSKSSTYVVIRTDNHDLYTRKLALQEY